MTQKLGVVHGYHRSIYLNFERAQKFEALCKKRSINGNRLMTSLLEEAFNREILNIKLEENNDRKF